MKNLTYSLLAGLVILLSACDSPAVNNAGKLNTKASLPPSLNFNALGYRVVTSSINKKLGTMSTLYGNKIALANAIAGNTKPGEEFTLITWKQQDDDRWFGAKIPGDLQTVETLKTDEIGKGAAYQCFKGKSLVPDTDTGHQAERIKYILEQKPSVMP
jgi:hypothetical protein